jgi:hypothetical protein
MSRRDKIQQKQLAALEAEFRETLVHCLRACARGRWGLFGAYDRFPQLNAYWPEKDRLRELAVSIQTIHAESGGHNALCDEFLNLRTMHGPNDPGEPRLASAFLKRIEEQNAQNPPETETRAS